MTRRSSSWAASAVVMTLILTGCGGPAADAPELFEAYGTVTLDGVTIADAQVMFTAPNQAPTVGRTDAEGRYEIHYNNTMKGAYPGENQVRISTAVDFEEDPDADEDEVEAGLRESLPSAYNGMTTLTVQVRDGGAPYDFPLTSDPNDYKPPQ